MEQKTSNEPEESTASYLLAAIVSSSDDAIVSKTLEGVVTSWNGGAERIFGYTASEVMGQSILTLIPADRQSEEPQILERLKQGERVDHFETMRIAKDGRHIEMSVTISPIKDAGGKIVGASKIGRDISQRKRAECAIRFLSEASAMLSSSLDFHITLQNVASLAVKLPADFCLFDLVIPERRLQTVAWAHRDPTKAALMERWRTISPLDFADYPLAAVVNSEKPEFRPQLNAEHFQEIAPNPEYLKLMRELCPTGLISVPISIRTRCLGALTFYRVQVNPEPFSQNDVVLAEELARRAALALDNAQLYAEVTAAHEESRRHTQDLEKTVAERTAQLRETIADLEAFSYSVSHDLRAPLRAMQGFSRVLLEEFGDKVGLSGRGYIDRISIAAARLERLIEGVLLYSRVGREISLAKVDLNRLLPEILEQYPNLQGTMITIRSPLLPVLAHEPSLIQCFSNLLGNAVKFVAPDTASSIVIWTEQIETRVRIWLRDNGVGIAPENQQRIFGLFSRVYLGRDYEGTGVGLAVVQKAVTRMGGKVGVESELGKGSRFWIELQSA